MKRLYWLFIIAVFAIVSCSSEEKTYGEQKKQEREVVSRFINRNVVMMIGNDTLLNLGKIKVITEEEFDLQDSTTNVENNEFVLFTQSGVYMQIVREGNGKRIEPGESRRLACRFWEYNMMGDSLQLTNRVMKFAVNPEIINVSNNSGYISGSFDLTVPTGSLIYKAYGDTQVPDGWLKALEFLRVGPQTTDENRIAKVRLIVPHSSGHSHATASVYPCFYELTFQEL
ncbi:MAG: DUF4827 domain-containing protein [Bacteroidaceae bacterium]|nr:DUF4827 domain-containing protein [Bacteroidaceae bacterium]